MCGRAVLPDKAFDYVSLLPEDFGLRDGENTHPIGSLDRLPASYISYNVAPTDKLPVIMNTEATAVQLMNWKYDMKIKGKMIPLFNSKIEQAEKKNAYFRYDLQERRCVVLIKGFYEWVKQDPADKKTQKQPVFIHLAHSTIMPLAGIYKMNEDGKRGCSIITTSPVERLEKVHTRMPYILQPAAILDYLSPRLDHDQEMVLDWLNLNRIDNESIKYYPVDQDVGKVANNAPELLKACTALFDF